MEIAGRIRQVNLGDDVKITPEGWIYLRASLSPGATTRLYYITYKAVDYAGNETLATTSVIVPHDMR